MSARSVRSRSTMGSSASAVVPSRRLSGRAASQSAHALCSASSSLTASCHRCGRLRRSTKRRGRVGTGDGGATWRARYRAWRSALLKACSPSGLQPLGMVPISVTLRIAMALTGRFGLLAPIRRFTRRSPVCAGSCPSVRCDGSCGPGDRGWRRPTWDPPRSRTSGRPAPGW
jgi:hypothetical protein